MTVKSRKVFSAVHTAVIVLSLVSPALAQTPSPSQNPQTEEEKQAAKAFEKKALSLINDIVAESASLRLVENRIYILTGASDLLWAHDEAWARELVRQAMDQVVAYIREAREKAAQEDERYFNLRHPGRQYGGQYEASMRQMVLNLLARRDAKLALEFLQLTRSLRPDENSRNPGEEAQEKMMEMNLASQVAENDPQLALRIAEEHLDGNLDYQAVSLWSVLQRKDPKAASPLTAKIIGGLKSQDILADYNASGLAFNVLNVLRSRINEISGARNNPDAPQADSAEIQQAYRDALEVVASATLKIKGAGLIDQDEANRARNLLAQIPGYLPDMEKFLPSRAAAVRARIAQFDNVRYSTPHEKFYAEHGHDLHSKSLQELLALAQKAPQEVRQGIYYHAVNKAIEQNNDETARKVIKENISDKWQANELLSMLDIRNLSRAVAEGKYADARKSISGMYTDEHRASMLADWASSAAGNGDEKLAREMLDEARSLIGSRMQRGDQLEAQIAVARAAIALDPNLSFEIAEAAIERVNRLIAANIEIQSFRGIDEGETRLAEGGRWNEYSGSIVPLFAQLARKDFDRAANLLRRWQSNELRLMMTLQLAQNILGGHGIGPGFGSGFHGLGGRIPVNQGGVRPVFHRSRWGGR